MTANAATKRTADLIGEDSVVDVFAQAAIFGAALTAKGYVAYEDEDARLMVYRTGAAPAHIKYTQLMDMVRAASIKHASEAIDADDAGTRRRARNTVRLLSSNAPGTKTYVQTVMERTREKLDLIDDDARDALLAQIKANTPAPAPAEVESRREYHAARRAKLDAEAREQTAAILTKWLPSLGAGKHELGDVWDAWQAAVGRSAKIKAEKPGVAKLGRTKFYEVLADVAVVFNGAARKRYVVVPDAVAS